MTNIIIVLRIAVQTPEYGGWTPNSRVAHTVAYAVAKQGDAGGGSATGLTLPRRG